MDFEAIIKQVKERPYIPERWESQDGKEVGNPVLMQAFWLGQVAKSVQIAETLYQHGVSREIAVKVIEPYLEF